MELPQGTRGSIRQKDTNDHPWHAVGCRIIPIFYTAVLQAVSQPYAASADQRERRRPRQAGTKSLLCRTRRPWRRKSKNRRQVFVELDEAYNECKVFLEDRGEREFNVSPPVVVEEGRWEGRKKETDWSRVIVRFCSKRRSIFIPGE